MTAIYIISAIWCVCGVVNYGFMVAHFQRKFSVIASETLVSDRVFAAFAGLTGPIGLLSTLSLGYYRKGWMA